MLSIYRAGEIDLFENLDIVHIRLLVDRHFFIDHQLVRIHVIDEIIQRTVLTPCGVTQRNHMHVPTIPVEPNMLNPVNRC